MINTFGNHSVQILLRITIGIYKDPVIGTHRLRADIAGRNDYFDPFIQRTYIRCLKSTATGAGYRNTIFVDVGTGEDRMRFEATSSDNLKFAAMDSTEVYFNPLSGVFSNYVYNALLTGRPYFLQMIEDTEIVSRFIQSHLKTREIQATATDEAKIVLREIVETLPAIKPKSKEDINGVKWSQLVMEKRELWPIHCLLPGGAYIR